MEVWTWKWHLFKY